jgi:tetratricopeptide (TPR) repeat protein
MTDVPELRRQLDNAYAAIQELDEDLAAGRVSAADHAELRARSERHAATLLTRVREAEHPAAVARPGRERVARPRLGALLRSPLGLAVGAAALLLFGLALGVLIARFASEDGPARAVAATGAPMPPPGMPGAGAAPAPARRPLSPALETMRVRVERETAPIPELLGFARAALDEGHVPPAIWAYKRVLAREPRNVEAVTRIAGILAQGNHVDEALRRLDEAVATDPRYAPAHWMRAQLLFDARQDYPAAVAALEKFLALTPAGEEAERARSMLASARQQAVGNRGVSPSPARGR